MRFQDTIADKHLFKAGMNVAMTFIPTGCGRFGNIGEWWGDTKAGSPGYGAASFGCNACFSCMIPYAGASLRPFYAIPNQIGSDFISQGWVGTSPPTEK